MKPETTSRMRIRTLSPTNRLLTSTPAIGSMDLPSPERYSDTASCAALCMHHPLFNLSTQCHSWTMAWWSKIKAIGPGNQSWEGYSVASRIQEASVAGSDLCQHLKEI